MLLTVLTMRTGCVAEKILRWVEKQQRIAAVPAVALTRKRAAPVQKTVQ